MTVFLCYLDVCLLTDLRLFASLGSEEGLILSLLKPVEKVLSFLQNFFLLQDLSSTLRGKKCRSVLEYFFLLWGSAE